MDSGRPSTDTLEPILGEPVAPSPCCSAVVAARTFSSSCSRRFFSTRFEDIVLSKPGATRY
jgi:hypothetical protein